jgi:hypothetical protein
VLGGIPANLVKRLLKVASDEQPTAKQEIHRLRTTASPLSGSNVRDLASRRAGS